MASARPALTGSDPESANGGHAAPAPPKELKATHDHDSLGTTVQTHGREPHRRRCCCRPLWRPLHLRLDGTTLQIDQEVVPLNDGCAATAVTAEVAADGSWLWPWPQPPPPGPAIRLVAPRQVAQEEWLLCAASEAQRKAWLTALQDAIDLSHGPGTPYADWSMGPALGAGSFGAVRAATHRRSGTRAVCKLIARAHGEHVREAVLREIAVLRQLDGAQGGGGGGGGAPIIRLVQSYEYRGDLLLLLTPLCNGDLLQLAEEHGAMSEAQAAAAMRATLAALRVVHAHGVCHLDVKPQNLLFRHPPQGGALARIDAHGVPADLVLADFGCARRLERAADGRWASLPDDGAGTIAFQPPEAFEEGVQGAHTDVWAAGCTGFSLLYLRPPFCRAGDSDDAVQLRILRGVPLYEADPAAAAAAAAAVAPPKGAAGEAAADAAADARPRKRRRPAAQCLSAEARAFFERLLAREYATRCTAAVALGDPWLGGAGDHQESEQPWVTW